MPLYSADLDEVAQALNDLFLLGASVYFVTIGLQGPELATQGQDLPLAQEIEDDV